MIRRFEGQREAHADAVRPMVLGYLAFPHENLTFAELDAALAFERTPEAGRFAEAAERGLRRGARGSGRCGGRGRRSGRSARCSSAPPRDERSCEITNFLHDEPVYFHGLIV